MPAYDRTNPSDEIKLQKLPGSNNKMNKKNSDNIEVLSVKNIEDNIDAYMINNDTYDNYNKKGTIWTNGPDNLIPASSYTAIELNDPVKLRLNNGIDADKSYKPQSIYTAFKNTVTKNPSHPALAFKSDGIWVEFSFEEYWKICEKAAKSFIKLGLEIGTSVAILGFNAPQWFISFLGAVFAGGIGCGIYTTNSSEACEYILKDSKSQIVVVENKTQLDKVLPIASQLNLKAIIQYTGKVTENYNGLLMSWQDFIDYGKSIKDDELNFRIKTIAPNKCASLIYTSGTTGSPKAAMISHDNIIYITRYLARDYVKLQPFKERFVSYLPLSHIAAQVIDLFASLYMGGTVYFAQPDALKGTLQITLNEAKPTFFFGVPRVWEKMQDRIQNVLKEQTGIKGSLIEWARKQATYQINEEFTGQINTNASYYMAKKLALDKIKNLLGFSECKHFYSGAAPTRKDTIDFFVSIGIPLCEVFGMSELTGPHSVGLYYSNKITSVGKCKDSLNKSKLSNIDADGCGELCVSGRHVFMGYLNSPEKTKETIDKDGWLLTGDVAKIDADGFLFITGRIKEIVITAGGENIAPVPIEDAVKLELPQVISSCMLIGDKRKYLTMLITLKCQINLDTLEPLDELTDECIEVLKKNGSNSRTVSQIANNKDKIAYKLIESAIKRANDKSISRAAKVQKFSILSRDFSVFHGELGPTMKLRRPIVNKMYTEVIENMYKDDGNND